MFDLPSNVREEIKILVPSSIIPQISCFTFYDNHPSDNLTLDIIVCTSNGEIIEFYKRNSIFKTLLNIKEFKEICIHRNTQGLHYIISAESNIYILSRKLSIELLRIMENIDRYVFDDILCKGEENLKVWFKEDAIPVVYNAKFDIQSELIEGTNEEITEDDSFPVLNGIKSRLIETKFLVNENKLKLKELIELKNQTIYAMYCKMYPQLKDVVFKKTLKECVAVLRVSLNAPLVKFCNNKIIITFNLFNENSMPLQDIEVIIHNTDKAAIAYETKLYNSCLEPPFWVEHSTKSILSQEKVTIVTTIDLKELSNCLAQNIEFSGGILYKIDDVLKLLPFDTVCLSHMECMNENFDVLSSSIFDNMDLLSIIATSIKTDLNITHIQTETHTDINIQDLLCECVTMNKVGGTENMVVHSSTPYHILHGVMIFCNKEQIDDNCFKITVFSRSKSQVISLIHYIYDAIPHRLMIYLPQTKITNKSDKKNDENLNPNQNTNVSEFGKSLIDQMSLILKFYDECILRMGSSGNESVVNLIGTKIDLSIGGKNHLEQFLNKMNAEIVNGFGYLEGKKRKEVFDVMEIDDD